MIVYSFKNGLDFQVKIIETWHRDNLQEFVPGEDELAEN